MLCCKRESQSVSVCQVNDYFTLADSGWLSGALHLGACPGSGSKTERYFPRRLRRTELSAYPRQPTQVMSTTEALRTQLAALQTDYYALQAENRHLKEANPQQAEALDTERELQQSREENVRLAQVISELRSAQEQLEGGDGEPRIQELEGAVATLTAEAETQASKLQDQGTELADTQAALERATRRATEAEQYAANLEKQLERVQNNTQLDQFRTVAEEALKWEVREERWVWRARELEEALARAGTWGERSLSGVGQEPAVDLRPSPHTPLVAFEDQSAQDRGSRVELGLASGETSIPSALLVADGKGTSTLSLHASSFTPSSDVGRGGLEGSLGGGGGGSKAACSRLTTGWGRGSKAAYSRHTICSTPSSATTSTLQVLWGQCGWGWGNFPGVAGTT